MDPDFGGVTFIEDNSDGNGLFLLTAYAKKFLKRSYKILCLVDDERMESFFKKTFGHESLDLLRIDDDPLGWDRSNSTPLLRNIDTLCQITSNRLEEKKMVLLLPCLSLIWITFDQVETMRFLVRIRSGCVGKADTSSSNAPSLIALINNRLLTNSQLDQFKYVSTLWTIPTKITDKDGNQKETMNTCRLRMKIYQKKGPKINEKTLTSDITNTFDMITALSKTESSPSKSIVDQSIIKHHIDPMAGLTFNLKLKENEAVARRNVQLPHLVVRDSIKQQIKIDGQSANANNFGGQVFYTPDEADDFDDEDPDADLDI